MALAKGELIKLYHNHYKNGCENIYFLCISCDISTLGFTVKHLIDLNRSMILPLQMHLVF